MTQFFELVKDAFLGLRPFSATESPLKMLKNAFCFIMFFSFSRYLNVFVDLLVMQKKDLIRRSGQFQNFWRHNLVNKQLQYTY